jgi:membrane fusion protein (multidrug efflux system)
VNLHGTIRPAAVILPQLAVQQGARGHFVVLANAKNEAEIRPVVVGPYFGDKEILIDQGLKAGDRVIVDGFARLAPNIPVIPVPAEKPAATAEKGTEKGDAKGAEKGTEKPAEKPAAKPAEKPAEKAAEKPAAPAR